MLWQHVVDLIAPGRCPACLARAADVWCEPCERGCAELLLPTGCARCGTPGRHRCALDIGAISMAHMRYVYDGVVAAGIARAKTRDAHAVWEGFGAEVAQSVTATPSKRVQSAVARAQAVTWIAPDARRLRARGFDHAQLLAAPIAGALHLPLINMLRAAPHTDQAGRSAVGRRALPAGTFVARRRIRGHVLLVDDVVTTGATMRVAADALLAGGAVSVGVVGLARSV